MIHSSLNRKKKIILVFVMQKIKVEIARTQKNKATAYHLGLLIAKLAKLRRELLTLSSYGRGGTNITILVMKEDYY